MFLIDENNYDDNVLLFHGAKKKFSLPVDLNRSKEQNDFGRGFYSYIILYYNIKNILVIKITKKKTVEYSIEFVNSLKGCHMTTFLNYSTSHAFFKNAI